MPNGHREPYRFQFPDIGDPDTVALSSWSPVHTSDSDETHDNKISFLVFEQIAYKVFFRWKFLVWRNKRRRRIAFPNLVYQALCLKFDRESASCIANFSALEIAFQNQSSTLGDIPYVSARDWPNKPNVMWNWMEPAYVRLMDRLSN